MAEPDPEKPTRENMSGKWKDLKGVSTEGRKWMVDRMLRRELREVLHIALQEIDELAARSKAKGMPSKP
jgi:siroheme synthase (precorrin-2 oxidase/ferrochelatase)